jgi:hypothetical protein
MAFSCEIAAFLSRCFAERRLLGLVFVRLDTVLASELRVAASGSDPEPSPISPPVAAGGGTLAAGGGTLGCSSSMGSSLIAGHTRMKRAQNKNGIQESSAT